MRQVTNTLIGRFHPWILIVLRIQDMDSRTYMVWLRVSLILYHRGPYVNNCRLVHTMESSMVSKILPSCYTEPCFCHLNHTGNTVHCSQVGKEEAHLPFVCSFSRNKIQASTLLVFCVLFFVGPKEALPSWYHQSHHHPEQYHTHMSTCQQHVNTNMDSSKAGHGQV